MGLSTIFITVQARKTTENEYIEHPVNVANILAYPPNEDDEFADAKTRIDLNAHFKPQGYYDTGGGGNDGEVFGCLFVKESPAEITKLIEDAQNSFMKRAKKNGIVLIM
jgi:hypothetical protein